MGVVQRASLSLMLCLNFLFLSQHFFHFLALFCVSFLLIFFFSHIAEYDSQVLKNYKGQQRGHMRAATGRICSASFSHKYEFYLYISRSPTAIFSSPLLQSKGITQHTALQIEARKKGSFQKQSLFELWFLWRQRCG